MKTKAWSVFLSAIFAFSINIQLHAQTGVFLISGSNNNSITGGIAFDGTNYLAGIAGDQISDSNLTVQFISQLGQLVGSRISLGETGSAPIVAFDGINYLVIWGDRYVRFLDDGNDAGMTNIYGRFINPSGSFVGNKFTIASNAYIKGCVSGKVLFNGSNYFFIYREDDGPNDYGPVYGQRISTTGSLLGSAFQISNYNAGDMDMSFDGTNYLVAFWTGSTQVYGQLVSNSGTLIGSNFLIDNSLNNSDNPISVTYGNSKFLVSFHDQAVSGNLWNLKAHFVATTGIVDLNTIMLADSSQNPMIPMVAYDGVNFLATWMNMNDKQIKGQFYNLAGLPYNNEFIIFDTVSGTLPIGGVASFSGNKYLSICTRVNWGRKNIMANNYGIYGKFIDHSIGFNEEINNKDIIKIFPNPTTNIVQMNIVNENIAELTLNIYNVAGILVKSEILTKNIRQINVGNLNNGVYMIEIKTKEWTKKQKLIIQR